MDMRDFLLGDADESGRDTVLCIQGNRLQAVKWRQWKAHLFQQDEFLSTWTAYNMPHLHNLEWDPREEHEVDFPHAWVMHPMAAAISAFMKTLADRAADQSRARPTPTRRPSPASARRRRTSSSGHHPVRHLTGEDPRRAAAAALRDGAPCRVTGLNTG